jgi:hypothetical protein
VNYNEILENLDRNDDNLDSLVLRLIPLALQDSPIHFRLHTSTLNVTSALFGAKDVHRQH